MKLNMLRRFCLLALVGGAGIILVEVLTQSSPTEAQTSPIKKRVIELSLPTTRTPRQMLVDDSRFPSIAATSKVIPFRPTIDRETYQRLKTQAQAHQPSVKPALLAAPTPKVTVQGINCSGKKDTQGLRPPDTHGAAGTAQFVEVTNSSLTVFSKADFSKAGDCPPAKLNVSLNAFFGYTPQTIFDPRAVYDTTWNRWIISAEAFNESSTVQRHFLAISKTADATGPYFIYNIDVDIENDGDFWDFPQLGINQDAVILTANIFPADGGFQGSRVIPIAKARLYNGLSFPISVFDTPIGSIAPPLVLDQNSISYLIAAPQSGSSLQLFKLTNSANASQASLMQLGNISVPAFTLPPSARQPGTTITLDTSDSRFVNASTQVGNTLWQVHTVNFRGSPTPKFYKIKIASGVGTVEQSKFFFASPTSDDWNASIFAPNANSAFVTWSSTDPAKNINAQVRVSSCNTATCNFGTGLALFTSPVPYEGSGSNPERWGDYSAVTPDPGSSRAWVVNQKNDSRTVWGSRYGRIGF